MTCFLDWKSVPFRMAWMMLALCRCALSSSAQTADPFTFSDDGKELTVTGYSGPGGAVVVPATSGGKKVTAIAAHAFERVTALTDIAIPNSVTAIGSFAFFECTQLRSVTLPDQLTILSERVFDGCENLATITLPAGVRTIEAFALGRCTKLAALTLPSGLTSIGSGAFAGSSGLTDIVLPDSVTTLGNEVFSNCTGLRTAKLPAGIKEIPGGFFTSCTSLTAVALPESVTTVFSNAFTNCTSLTTIALPSRLTGIGPAAFYWCTHLGTVVVPDSVLSIGNSAFAGCSGLTAIKLPAGLDGISQGLFTGCAALRAITLPDSVTAIGDFAFQQCTGLQSIALPSQLKTIGRYAFERCTQLGSVAFPPSLGRIYEFAFHGCSSLTNLVLPTGLEIVGQGSFQSCRSLESISLSRTVFLETLVFGYCPSLRVIEVSARNPYYQVSDGVMFDSSATQLLLYPSGSERASYAVPEGVERIAPGAFSQAVHLSEVLFPDSLTTIGSFAFEGSERLAAVRLPRNLAAMGAHAFGLCASLREVTFTAASNPAGDFGFAWCQSLAKIILAEGMTTIGNSTFNGCSALTTITLPASITTIGSNAFSDCASLSAVYFQGDAPRFTGDRLFANDHPLLTLYYFSNAAGFTNPWRRAPTASVPIVPSKIVNIATRAYCGTNNRVTIGGFVISGTAPKRVLIRAVGPSLTAQGLGSSEVLADPTMELHDATRERIVATNDNWLDGDAAEIARTAVAVGAAPLLATDSASSAIVLTLDPGVYTFVVNGKAGSSGVVLLEAYDTNPTAVGSSFVNIATRAYSADASKVTIGGFVISGTFRKRVLIRAVGSTLATQGIPSDDVLGDPKIELHDALQNNRVLAHNLEWADRSDSLDLLALQSRVGAAPIYPLDTKSAALVLFLAPGVYSFIASAQSGPAGIALVEIYDAD